MKLCLAAFVLLAVLSMVGNPVGMLLIAVLLGIGVAEWENRRRRQ